MSEPLAAPRVAVVVLSWNRRDDLGRCLDALSRQTYAAHEVVVVDNGSRDGSAAMVHSLYPGVRLIRSEINLGFAAGNNLAIRATDTPYVATLNNDALAEADWLEALVAAAEADTTLGSVASKMVFQHDPATINSCGIALDRAGIAWDLWGGYPADLIDRPREVFGACAGAALYRRSMLDDVGLFDEDFFAYLEDVDLAWRARLRGWRCVLAPDAVVRHAHSGTLGEGSPLKRYLLARNKIWTVAKCAPGPHLLADLPVAALYDAGAVTFGVARHRDWASLCGRLAGIAGLPRMLRKRAEIQQRRTLDARSLEALYAPLAMPWDVPRRYRHLVGVRGQGSGVGEVGSPGGQGSGLNSPGPGGSKARILRSSRRFGSAGSGLGLVSAVRLKANLRLSLLRFLGKLLIQSNRPQPPTPNPQPLSAGPRAPTSEPSRGGRVVVLRPDHLGDVLLSRPAIEALASVPRRHGNASPQAVDLTVVAGPWATASLQGLPVRVVAFDFPGFTRKPKGGALAPYGALLAFAARLRRERYDAALVLRPDHWWGALAAAAAGIPIRVGHATPEVGPFLTHRVAVEPTEHASRGSLRAADALADALGLEPLDLENAVVRFQPSLAALAHAKAWIGAQVAAGRPIVVLHPGAGAPIKTWPARRWATIAAALRAEAAIVLTGGPADADLLAGIQAASAEPLPCASDLTWDQLAGLYQRADVVVGMDSGPLHLATAVGTPTVRVYGPTDPRIYGPALHPQAPTSAAAVLHAALPCIPCGNLVAPPCGYLQDPPCLASVAPQAVVAAVRGALPVATTPA